MWDLSDRKLIANLYSNQAHNWLLRNRPRRALKGCKRALFLNPKLDSAYLNRGLARLRLRQAEGHIAFEELDFRFGSGTKTM